MADDSGLATARQWAMLRSIPRHPLKISTKELEARLLDDGFGVSRRTIERDLHLLSNHFPLVMDDRSKPYGWSWARDAVFEFMPKLTTSQAVALLLARTHLDRLLPGALRSELQPAFNAAEITLADSGWKDWHRQTAVVAPGLSLLSPPLPATVLSCISSALARRRCVRAGYRAKGTRDAREMLVHPLGLFARGPVLYLVCTLFDYEDVRQLAMHRISNPIETGEQAKSPAGFDFERYVEEVAPRYLSRGPIRVVARFDGSAAEHLADCPLSADQQWRQLPDGRVEISATVEDDETLHWWLLAFGSQVEVLAPADLRSWMKAEIEASLDAYLEASEELTTEETR